MNCRENDMHRAKGSSTETPKFFRYIKTYWEKILKHISTYCTKRNETYVCHLAIKKHVSYEKRFKYYIYFCIQVHIKVF